jgi:hypothetical protein
MSWSGMGELPWRLEDSLSDMDTPWVLTNSYSMTDLFIGHQSPYGIHDH